MKLQDFSIIKWIYDNDLKIETGLPFSWKDHMYLYDIYRDFSPKQVIYKAAQIGYSTLAVLKSFWIAKNLGIDIIYTLPSATDMQDFVGSKTNRIIAQNPILQQWVKDRDTIEQKEVGNNIIYYRGTWSQKQAQMVSSDLNIYDEVDSCYEPDTEVLTKTGWKKVQEVTMNDRVCTLNQKDHRVVFQQPEDVMSFNYNDSLYRFTANQIDIAVTRNHNMWARVDTKQKLHKAPTLLDKPFVMTSKGTWNDYKKDDGLVSIPYVQTKVNRERINYKSRKVDALAFYEFLGWYLSEGNIYKLRNKHGRQKTNGDIIITQKRGMEFDKIVDCIKRLGYEPKVYENNREVCSIKFRDIQLALYLQSLGYSGDKYIPTRYLYTKKKYLRVMLEAMMLGDGDDRNVITTKSKKMADTIQIVALQLNLSASIYFESVAGVYRVGIIQKPYRRFNGYRKSNSTGKVTVEAYKGKVYCLTVPNGVIMVRGKEKQVPLWSGNSNQVVVDQYSTRLQASDYKWEWYFSHPSVPNNGVARYWHKSDQKHWFINCDNEHLQYLSWPESFDMEKKIYVCKECDIEISDDNRRRGRWIKKVKEAQFSGYWIPLFLSTKVSAGEIIGYYNDKTEEYFYNKVLGLPHASSDAIVAPEVIYNNCTSTVNMRETRTIIGVDTGLGIHLVAGNRDGMFYYSSTQDYMDFERLMADDPKAIAVFDAQGDLQKPRELQEKYPHRIYLCYYKSDGKGGKLAVWKDNDDKGIVHIDRNRMIDYVIDNFKSKRMPLQGTVDDWHDYQKHWANIYREDTESSGGIKVRKWLRRNHDHLCFTAGTKIITSNGEKNIEDIKPQDRVLTRQGFKKVNHTMNRLATVRDFGVLEGTLDHPVWTTNGFKPLHTMDYSDTILVWNQNKLLTKGLSFVDILIQRIEQKEFTSSPMEHKEGMVSEGFTRRYTKTTMVLSLKALRYITTTVTRLITHQTTWLQCQAQTTCRSTLLKDSKTQSIDNGTKNILIESDLKAQNLLESGGTLRRARKYLGAMLTKLLFSKNQRGSSVCCVKETELPPQDKEESIAVQNAKEFSPQESGGKNTPTTTKRVYNLEVDDAHEYFANDILVSNCHSTVYFMAGVQKFSGATGGIIGGSNALKGVRTGPTIQPDQSVQFNPIKGMFKKNV